jgi:hypothetical protein
LAAANFPILCLDTCTILDVMRDLTRDTIRPDEARAAQGIIAAMEAGTALGLVAAQVELEVGQRLKTVEDQARANLDEMRARLKRMDQVATLFGGDGVTSIAHMDDHVTRTRIWVDRLMKAAVRVKPGHSVEKLANMRSIQGRAPAPKGQGAIKDCLVFETYLDLGRKLMANGFAQQLLFVSSNTNDYGSTGTPKPDIRADANAVNMTFYSSIGAAKHALGL